MRATLGKIMADLGAEDPSQNRVHAVESCISTEGFAVEKEHPASKVPNQATTVITTSFPLYLIPFSLLSNLSLTGSDIP